MASRMQSRTQSGYTKFYCRSKDTLHSAIVVNHPGPRPLSKLLLNDGASINWAKAAANSELSSQPFLSASHFEKFCSTKALASWKLIHPSWFASTAVISVLASKVGN